jgi:hypothetical protein
MKNYRVKDYRRLEIGTSLNGVKSITVRFFSPVLCSEYLLAHLATRTAPLIKTDVTTLHQMELFLAGQYKCSHSI